MTIKKSQTKFTFTTAIVDQFISTEAPDLNAYISEALGTDDWALCPNTKNNRAKHKVCLSHTKYNSFARQFLKNGGDPDEVIPRIAAECGWVRRWVRIEPEAGK